jgi:hypothetical protein
MQQQPGSALASARHIRTHSLLGAPFAAVSLRALRPPFYQPPHDGALYVRFHPILGIRFRVVLFGEL